MAGAVNGAALAGVEEVDGAELTVRHLHRAGDVADAEERHAIKRRVGQVEPYHLRTSDKRP